MPTLVACLWRRVEATQPGRVPTHFGPATRLRRPESPWNQGALATSQVEVCPRTANSGPVVARQHGAGQVVEADPAVVAAVALPMSLGVVAPVADHRGAAAAGAADALGPALLAHERVALGVVDQGREVHQAGRGHGRLVRRGIHPPQRAAAPFVTPLRPTPRIPRRAAGKTVRIDRASSEHLASEFEHQFEPERFTGLGRYEIAVRLLKLGAPSTAFTG